MSLLWFAQSAFSRGAGASLSAEAEVRRVKDRDGELSAGEFVGDEDSGDGPIGKPEASSDSAD